jgi:hypothetical protein
MSMCEMYSRVDSALRLSLPTRSMGVSACTQIISSAK